MQRHGLIVADNGSNWYFTGTSEQGWDTALLDQLKTIPAGAFEAVDTSSLLADPNSGLVASSSAPPATAPPGPTTTTRPRATTTTSRPHPTTTTTPPASATSATSPAPAPAPETSTTTSDPEPTTTTTAAQVAAPAGSPPLNDAEPGRSRRWWLGIPVGIALAVGFAARRRR
jgi:hypothetical protein